MKTVFLLLTAAVLAFCMDQADFFSTDSGPVLTTPIYDSAMMLVGSGKVIHVNPSSQANYKGLAKADLILITNDSDLDMAEIPKISKKNTVIIAPAGPAPQLPRCTALNNGESVSFGDISIEATPAYNIVPPGSDKKPAHPKGAGNGYIVTYPGLRIYISGDTSFIPEMKKFKNIGLAFLSVGTPDTMSLEEGAETLRLLRPTTVYPNHYRQTPPDEVKKGLTVPGVEIRMRYWY